MSKWSIPELCKRHSIEELVAISEGLRSDPKNANPRGGIYLFNKETNKKLDNIGFAISTLMREDKNGTN